MRFASYASSCIRREICRALSSRSRLVRLPARLADASTRVKGTDRRLAQQLGRRPTAAEVAEAAGVTERMVEDLRRSEQSPVSLSEPIGEREVTLQDVLADDPSHDPARIVASAEDGAIDAALSPPRAAGPRRSSSCASGSAAASRATLASVAATLGLSPARVRQLEVRSLLELSRCRDAARPAAGGVMAELGHVAAPYDLIAIGSGPAGQRAAVQAAKLGRRAAIVERQPSARRRLDQHRHRALEDAARRDPAAHGHGARLVPQPLPPC